MTRYEQGFMRKCAEYGVDYGMVKRASKLSAALKILGIGLPVGAMGYSGYRHAKMDKGVRDGSRSGVHVGGKGGAKAGAGIGAALGALLGYPVGALTGGVTGLFTRD